MLRILVLVVHRVGCQVCLATLCSNAGRSRTTGGVHTGSRHLQSTFSRPSYDRVFSRGVVLSYARDPERLASKLASQNIPASLLCVDRLGYQMVRSEPFGSNAESLVVWIVRDYVVGLAQLDGRSN